MLALATGERKINFEAIDEQYAAFFEDEVLDGYEGYAGCTQAPILPLYFFHGQQSFIDAFVETFAMLRASYTNRHYPEFDWDSSTEEEKEFMDEIISQEYVEEEGELIEDIGRVFDHYQLFHIIVDEVGSMMETALIVNHYNSPLQEVW